MVVGPTYKRTYIASLNGIKGLGKSPAEAMQNLELKLLEQQDNQQERTR